MTRFIAYESYDFSAIFDEQGNCIHTYNKSMGYPNAQWHYLVDNGIDKTLKEVAGTREVTRLELKLRGVAC